MYKYRLQACKYPKSCGERIGAIGAICRESRGIWAFVGDRATRIGTYAVIYAMRSIRPIVSNYRIYVRINVNELLTICYIEQMFRC